LGWKKPVTDLINLPLVEVAAAVLQCPDGSFLLAQRPPGKIWAGYWEFPGGKVEPGENFHQALVRELQEELGIKVETAYPWLTRVFTYPHATVRLTFFRVTAWSGVLHPHEGQKFSWEALQAGTDVSVSPVLPANAPILRALSLPPVYAISNAAELGTGEFLRRLQAALQNGLKLLQLREKHLARAPLHDLAVRVVSLAKLHDAKVLLNDDVALALEVGANGIHLSSAQLSRLDKRPDVEWCGASCHTQEELRHAERLMCDFAVLGPVMPTQSHPNAIPIGWEGFATLSRGASIPVYALGGLRFENIHAAWQHGAHGIAMMRQAWEQNNFAIPLN
jgi:8-oxo-dGTP diphosphatase